MNWAHFNEIKNQNSNLWLLASCINVILSIVITINFGPQNPECHFRTVVYMSFSCFITINQTNNIMANVHFGILKYNHFSNQIKKIN